MKLNVQESCRQLQNAHKHKAAQRNRSMALRAKNEFKGKETLM